MIPREKVKDNSIVGKWDVCISAKERVRALRPTGVDFPMTLKVAVYVPKGKGKGQRKGSNSPRSASPAGCGGRDTPRGGSSPRGSSRGRSIDHAKYKI